VEREMRIGFLASGRGSNMQAVIDACRAGEIEARPCVVISNNSRSGAIERARREGIPVAHLSSVTHPDPERLDRAICDTLSEYRTDLVLLVGYMRRIGPRTLAQYGGRILNIHPALLPRFGGEGMYGPRVHEAVLTAGESMTGVTIHIVDGEYDHGPIVAQRKVPVMASDTAETLAHRVLEHEHDLLVDTVARVAAGTLTLPRG
jgi:phosphoribosylglycinamide formyltransferase-1